MRAIFDFTTSLFFLFCFVLVIFSFLSHITRFALQGSIFLSFFQPTQTCNVVGLLCSRPGYPREGRSLCDDALATKKNEPEFRPTQGNH